MSTRPQEVERAAPDKSREARPESGISLRAWLLAIGAQIVILLWVVRSEITGRVFISSWTLSMPGVILLLALLTWNAARRRRPLTRAEMLVAYVAVSSTITLVGYNFFQVLIPTLGTVLYLQTPENRWGLILPHLPGWLLPQEREGLRGLFLGQSAVPWDIWLVPLLAWSALILAVVFASLALNGLLADLWIRRERLAFPIASVPLEVSQPGTPLFHSRLFWIGFLLPALLNSLLALNYYYPSVPAIELRHKNYLHGVTALPLAALGLLSVGFTPFIIGLAFLAPLDVSFSIWFFLWLGKAQRLLAYGLGYMDPTDLGSAGPPYLKEQTVGAFLALGLWIVWRAFQGAGVQAFRRSGVQEPSERLNARSPEHRLLTIVLVLSLAYILTFMALAGFSLLLASALIVLYFLTVLVISRVRSEAGFAWAYGPDRFATSLSHIVVNTCGTRSFSPRDIALMGFFHWLWWDLRFALMPAQMDALKIGDAAHIRRRQLLTLIAVATVVAVVVGLPWALHESYRLGWGTAKTYIGPSSGAQQACNMTVHWLQNPTLSRWDKTLWTVVGGLVTVFLGMMRHAFTWWPFHPIGYAMAATLTSESFWGHYLLAWLTKLLLLRYGGLRLYRAVLPLIFGLILGDIASQTLWSIGAAALDVPVYSFVQ